MKKIKRGEDVACNNYYHCIKNLQFLIVNYIRDDAPYCVNLSSLIRKKILRNLKWMGKYLIDSKDEENKNIRKKLSTIPGVTRLKSFGSRSGSQHSNLVSRMYFYFIFLYISTY